MSDDYRRQVIKVGKFLKAEGIIDSYALDGGMLWAEIPDSFRMWMCYDPVYDYCITIQNLKRGGGCLVGASHDIEGVAGLIRHVVDNW